MHEQSFRFAHLEVLRVRSRAQRAIAHLETAKASGVPELLRLAHHTCEAAVRTYRCAINKRNFELRQLTAA